MKNADDSPKARGAAGLAGTVRALEDCQNPQIAAHLLERLFARAEALGDALLTELLLARWKYSWGGINMFEEARESLDRPHIIQIKHPDHERPTPACKACMEESWEQAKSDRARVELIDELLDDRHGSFMKPNEANVSIGSPHIHKSNRVQNQERGWGEEEEFLCEHVLAECQRCLTERYIACQTYLTQDPEHFTIWDIQITRDDENNPTISRTITAPYNAPYEKKAHEGA